MIEIAESISSFSPVSPVNQPDQLQVILDRLQALEETVTALQEENVALRAQVAAQDAKIAALEGRQEESDSWQEAHSMENALAYRRISALEGKGDKEPSERTTAHLMEIKDVLTARQRSGIRFLSYHDAADILDLTPQRIRQLGELAANDSTLGINVAWHPKKKNAKIFILK